jgi:hypothetical protein
MRERWDFCEVMVQPVFHGESTDSLKYRLGRSCPSTLCPEGSQTLKRPYSCRVAARRGGGLRPSYYHPGYPMPCGPGHGCFSFLLAFLFFFLGRGFSPFFTRCLSHYQFAFHRQSFADREVPSFSKTFVNRLSVLDLKLRFRVFLTRRGGGGWWICFKIAFGHRSRKE